MNSGLCIAGTKGKAGFGTKMEENTMVTVLMATYRGKQYLEQQLDTILAQTVPVKILISDDGSDDGTREML